METEQVEQLIKSLEDALQKAQTWDGIKAASEKNTTDLSALQTQLDTLKAFQKDLESKAARADVPIGSPTRVEYKSIGSVLYEADEYKTILEGHKKSCDEVKIDAGFFGHWKWMQTSSQKDLSGALTSDPLSAGGLVQEQLWPNVILSPNRVPRLRDLIPVFPTESNAIEYIQETNFHQIYAQCLVDMPAPGNTIVVDNVSGFYVSQVVVLDPNGIGFETATILTISPNEGRGGPGELKFTAPTVNTHLKETEIVSDTFIWTHETELKPKANQTFLKLSESVKTLAHWLPATRQILEDASVLRQLVDGRLIEGLMLSEETQLLYGAGGADEIQGIMTHGGAQSYLWSSGAILPVPDTKIDAVRRAMTLSALAHYPVDGILVHPTDWEDIELAKGADGHYILAPVMSGNAVMLLWRVPVVVTTALDPGDFLVGNFAQAAAIFDRQQANVRVAEQHEDFFVRNMMVVLAEERLAFIVFRPEAFVVGTFDSAPF